LFTFFTLQNRQKRPEDLLWVQSERKDKKTPNACKHQTQQKYTSWGSEKKMVTREATARKQTEIQDTTPSALGKGADSPNRHYFF